MFQLKAKCFRSPNFDYSIHYWHLLAKLTLSKGDDLLHQQTPAFIYQLLCGGSKTLLEGVDGMDKKLLKSF